MHKLSNRSFCYRLFGERDGETCQHVHWEFYTMEMKICSMEQASARTMLHNIRKWNQSNGKRNGVKPDQSVRNERMNLVERSMHVVSLIIIMIIYSVNFCTNCGNVCIIDGDMMPQRHQQQRILKLYQHYLIISNTMPILPCSTCEAFHLERGSPRNSIFIDNPNYSIGMTNDTDRPELREIWH